MLTPAATSLAAIIDAPIGVGRGLQQRRSRRRGLETRVDRSGEHVQSVAALSSRLGHDSRCFALEILPGPELRWWGSRDLWGWTTRIGGPA